MNLTPNCMKFAIGFLPTIQPKKTYPRSPYAGEFREASGVRPACWRFRMAWGVRKREQAPRTPNASRHSVAGLPRCAPMCRYPGDICERTGSCFRAGEDLASRPHLGELLS